MVVNSEMLRKGMRVMENHKLLADLDWLVEILKVTKIVFFN